MKRNIFAKTAGVSHNIKIINRLSLQNYGLRIKLDFAIHFSFLLLRYIYIHHL